jgi:hypothetical protein
MSSRGRIFIILAVTGLHGSPFDTVSGRELISILSLAATSVSGTSAAIAVAVDIMDVVPCVVKRAVFTGMRICTCQRVLLVHRTAICCIDVTAVVVASTVATASSSLLELVTICHRRHEPSI